jgi:hypothetical protein
MAWAIDFWVHYQVIAANPASHNHTGGDAIIRINFPMTGFPLIVFGMWQLMGSENLAKRPGFLAFVGGILMAVDGLVHAFAFNDHMNDYSAPLFASLAPAQIGVGVALPFLSRRYDGFWILGALALVVAYAVSRTVSIPALALPEPVEGLGVFSKVLEVSFVIVTLANMRRAPAPEGSRDRDASNPASAVHAD